MTNRRPIPIKDLTLKGEKLQVKPKRYDVSTELKRKRSPRKRYAKPGEVSA